MLARRTALLTLAATAALGAPAASASTVALTGPTTKVTLDSAETKAQAATWEKPGGWQETQKYCESLNGKFPSRVCGNSVSGKRALNTKRSYRITVSGLVSVNATATALPCGTEEKLPDGTTPAGTDSQFEFANNLDPATCYLTDGPVGWDAFRWSMDGGKTWVHPVADTKPTKPTADHTYTFSVLGKGKKPQFRWYDVATTDNKGVLSISYRQKKPPAKKKH